MPKWHHIENGAKNATLWNGTPDGNSHKWKWLTNEFCTALTTARALHLSLHVSMCQTCPPKIHVLAPELVISRKLCTVLFVQCGCKCAHCKPMEFSCHMGLHGKHVILCLATFFGMNIIGSHHSLRVLPTGRSGVRKKDSSIHIGSPFCHGKLQAVLRHLLRQAVCHIVHS